MIGIAVLLISGSPMRPSPALDDSYKLARMVLRAADIGDGHVRHGRGIADDTAKPVGEPSVAAARPRGKALAKNFRRRRDRDHHDIRIGAAYRFNYRARYIGDHRAPGADIVIERAGQCVAVAMCFPMNSEVALAARLPEGVETQLLIFFERRRFPRHRPAWKNNVVVAGARCLGKSEQGILAGPTRTDHQDEPTRS